MSLFFTTNRLSHSLCLIVFYHNKVKTVFGQIFNFMPMKVLSNPNKISYCKNACSSTKANNDQGKANFYSFKGMYNTMFHYNMGTITQQG